MRSNVIILYVSAWMFYVAFSLSLFPAIRINACMPVVVLTGVGAWLFGRTIGLLTIIPLIGYQAFLTSVLYADLLDVYVYKFSGIMILIIISLLVGSLKSQYTAITLATRELDRMVEERNGKLRQLTTELLDNAEKQRVEKGQELHDGMGQQLTGVQLLCASILNQLEHEKNKYLSLARNLEALTCQTHNHIRRLARMLFPVRMAQVGLLAALSELASCLTELKSIDFSVKELADLQDIPESTALQIYRICQESALYVIDGTQANQISITLNMDPENYILIMTHNGRPTQAPDYESLLKLINYRLNQLTGTLTRTARKTGQTNLTFTIPKTIHSNA